VSTFVEKRREAADRSPVLAFVPRLEFQHERRFALLDEPFRVRRFAPSGFHLLEQIPVLALQVFNLKHARVLLLAEHLRDLLPSGRTHLHVGGGHGRPVKRQRLASRRGGVEVFFYGVDL
jgi:hypothetical protein